MCFLFVFSAILEYAFVSYLVFKNREEEREKETMRKKHDDVSGRKKTKSSEVAPHTQAQWPVIDCNQ